MDTQPLWLARAWAELGEKEGQGTANAAILGYARAIGHDEVGTDEVAWCAAFVGACLERAGFGSTRSLAARSYLDWRTALTEPRDGAITVLSRGSDPALGHVGFLIGWTQNEVILLGGNQGNAVSVASFERSRVLGMRWPDSPAPATGRDAAPAANPAASAIATDFETALAFVLEQEGGYSEDPYDPGGPTNQGITLGDYAAFKGVQLATDNYDALKQQLRSISPAEVRAIYSAQYWSPSQCPLLSAGVGVMHFDTAVNQGLGRAARLLQQSCGADIDGAIGPLTLAAAADTDAKSLIANYADLRRAHYRGLSHFWRFGRGWLARVDAAQALALRLADNGAPAQPPKPVAKTDVPVARRMDPDNDGAVLAPVDPPPANPRPSTPRTKENNMDSQPKWWGQSMTIWGAITTTLTTVLPIVGPLLGINITADMVQQLGGQFVQLVQVLGGVIGTIMTIYGRTRATQPLERRPVSLRI